MVLPGQNRNDAAEPAVLSPSRANNRSPGRASSGVSVSARRSLAPPAERTRPTGVSLTCGVSAVAVDKRTRATRTDQTPQVLQSSIDCRLWHQRRNSKQADRNGLAP